jgi:hypothetical protein
VRYFGNTTRVKNPREIFKKGVDFNKYPSKMKKGYVCRGLSSLSGAVPFNWGVIVPLKLMKEGGANLQEFCQEYG